MYPCPTACCCCCCCCLAHICYSDATNRHCCGTSSWVILLDLPSWLGPEFLSQHDASSVHLVPQHSCEPRRGDCWWKQCSVHACAQNRLTPIRQYAGTTVRWYAGMPTCQYPATLYAGSSIRRAVSVVPAYRCIPGVPAYQHAVVCRYTRRLVRRRYTDLPALRCACTYFYALRWHASTLVR